MFPFSRNNTSTPARRSGGSIGSSSNACRKAENNSPYFSRFFSSPGSRNIATLSPSLSLRSPRQNIPIRRELPPSLFNFSSPARQRLPQAPKPVSSRPRNAIEFLSQSNSSMMERALRVLESKRKKRSNEAFLEDEPESEHVSLKRYRTSEENNSSPLLARSIPMPPQDVEIISHSKLNQPNSTSRPSSSKLPDQVSRLSSAALEAIAFGMKRRRPEDEEREGEDVSGNKWTPNWRCSSAISNLDEKSSPISPPPTAKRRVMRDCETQTVFLVDSATNTSELLSSPHQRRHPTSSNRPASVSRFIAGLEARARANALSKRLAASPITVLTQADSLEARHAKIRQMFADLTEKAEVDLANNTSSVKTPSPLGFTTNISSPHDIASSSMPILPPVSSLAAVSSVAPLSSIEMQPVTVLSGTASVATGAVITEPPVATACSLPSALPPSEQLSNISEQSSVTSAGMMNLPFVFGLKSTASTGNTTLTPSSSVTSTSVAPSFTFSMESTSQKSDEQQSFTKTTATALSFTPPVSKPISALGQTSVSETTFPSAISASSAASVAVTSSASGFTFTLAKSTPSGSSATVSSMPNFDFSTIPKSSMPAVSTTAPFAPLVTTSSSLSPSTSSANDTRASSAASLFNFPSTITTTTDIATVAAAAATTSGGIFISSTVTSTSNVSASSASSAAATAQLDFTFKKNAPTSVNSTLGTSPMFDFSARSPPLNATTGTVPLVSSSALTMPACNFSAKPDAIKTNSFFTAPAATTASSVLAPAKSIPAFSFVPTTSTTTASSLFDFSTKSTTAHATIGEAVVPVVNFNATVTTAAAAATTTSNVSFSFPVKSAFSNGNTAIPSFGFPGVQSTPTTITATNTPSFPFPKTNTSGLTNGGSSDGLFGTAPFKFQNSSNLTSITSVGSGFAFTSPSTIITATTTTPVSFNFSSAVTTTTPTLGGGGLSGFNFSSSVAPVAGSSTAFAPKSGTGVFQFGAQPTTASTTTSASSGFSLTLSSTKSSPSIFSINDHTKRTGDSSFSDGLSAPKLQASAFGGGPVNPSPFGGTNVQTFNFGGSGAAAPGNIASASSGGFNFSAAVTEPVGSFNFSQTQSAPVFGGAGRAQPNPFSAVAPTPPNATAAFQQRRRQIRYSKRR